MQSVMTGHPQHLAAALAVVTSSAVTATEVSTSPLRVCPLLISASLSYSGCRKENYDGCMDIAGMHEAACEQWTPWEDCQDEYNQAASNCAANYPQKRARSAAPEDKPFNMLSPRTEGGSCGSNDLFEHVDMNRDGLIDLEEYVAFMNKNQGDNFNHTRYANYFYSYVEMRSHPNMTETETDIRIEQIRPRWRRQNRTQRDFKSLISRGSNPGV